MRATFSWCADTERVLLEGFDTRPALRADLDEGVVGVSGRIVTKGTDRQFLTEVAYADGARLTDRAALLDVAEDFGRIIDRLVQRAADWPQPDDRRP